MIFLWCTETTVQATTQELKVRQLLKRLNKPAVKSIKMRPSIPPSGLYDKNEVASKMETSSIHQLWRQNGRCPENTIPIKRTKKEDVLRASSVERYGKKSHRTIPNPTSSYSSYMQEIVKGHEVYPNVNGDSNTRLFTYWTQDGYQATGCYDLKCPGFVQVSNELALGAAIGPVSTYDGPQYEITLYVWKDPKTGNWWLQYQNLSPLGYWPSSLFPYLTNGSSMVEWGGEILNYNTSGEHTTTEMGSGHFPEEGSGKASFFKNIQIVDQSNNLQAPQGFESFNTTPTCYHVHFADEGYFYYGGPGRNPNCL
ncbi:hypothetical protein COCNU_14G012420 [Cocos nucifera]|uniref:Neprosin PEP catalytic domain-containing protein n=1 Tax=Cocos nucifera TaxID=13894 RepID=A0A8K0IW88_COCNU|nr:hypothetical protein COCNU_14G012420 [Cocos nucifera]